MPVNYTALGDQLRAASRLQPTPIDRSEGLLADQAGPFSRSPAPLLFADTPIAGSTPTYADILAYWAQRDPRLEQMLASAGAISNVVPLPVKPSGPVFRQGTSGKPIPLTPENIDRVYGGKDGR